MSDIMIMGDVKFMNKDQSEEGFLIPIDRTTVARAVSTR
jgi:hypothetical protein